MRYEDANARFDRHIAVAANGCWEWQAARNRNGYGVMKLSRPRRQVLAHRFAYERFVGLIPAGLLVCHHCDNKRCVNPEHLFAGQHLDNANDKSRKGRGAKKLTASEVLQMRAERAGGDTFAAIGKRHGIGQMTAWRTITGKRWKFV